MVMCKEKDKKEMPVEAYSDALSVTLACDVMGLEELSDYPELKKEPDRNHVIMGCVALGISQNVIADTLGVSQVTITRIVNRIDPERKMRVSKAAKKAFLTRLYETRAMEALSYITPEKLKAASARDLMALSKQATDAMASMNQSKHRDISSNKLDRMLAALEDDTAADVVEVGDATYEEE